jgi:hypothetical protein
VKKHNYHTGSGVHEPTRIWCLSPTLVRDGQTHPHRPRLVVSHSTCPPLSSSPHAHSFVIGPAVIKHTHTHTHSDPDRLRESRRRPARSAMHRICHTRQCDPHTHAPGGANIRARSVGPFLPGVLSVVTAVGRQRCFSLTENTVVLINLSNILYCQKL